MPSPYNALVCVNNSNADSTALAAALYAIVAVTVKISK